MRLEKELETKLNMENRIENELIDCSNILSSSVVSENDYGNRITKFKKDIKELKNEEEEVKKKIEDIEMQIKEQEDEIKNNEKEEEYSDEMKRLLEIENEITRYQNQLQILQNHCESLKSSTVPNKTSEMLRNGVNERNEKKEIEVYEKLFKKVIDNLNN